MANYTYGPPPPAPPPAQQASTGYYPQQPYGQAAPRGGGAGRGGYNPAGRGDYHGQSHGQSHGYNPQAPQQQYGPNPPQQGGYGPPQWQQDQQHASAPQPHPQPVMLPAQNYHPNYAPQMYQQSPYTQQPAYQAPAQNYAHQYPQAAQPPAPQTQPWGPPSHGPPASHAQQNGSHFGGGRGRGGHHNDRGGSKAPIVAPPIRWNFDQSTPNPSAPVSNPYPTQQYGPPQAGPAPYAAGPYPSYSGPPHMGGPSSHGPPHHGRGGFNHNSSRGGRFGDKRGGGFKKHGAPSNNFAVSAHHQKPDGASSGKKKKRKTNTLGLTPGDESEEEDDADEETRLAELYLADAPQPESISAWIAERRQNFPTQARAKAKLANASNGDKVKNEASKDSASSLQKQQQKAEKLRKQLEKVESSIKRKREQQDEGDEMRDVDKSGSVSSDSKSDDEGPETLPSRPNTNPVPPPARKADPTKHCKYFSTGGVCGKKNKCRFVHDASVRETALKAREMNGGRMTLQQRLVLNDKDQEDLTIVKTLQYLKDKGAMKGKSPDAAADQGGASHSSMAAQSHLPPPPVTPAKDIKMESSPHGLPPHPHSHSSDHKPYAGWNMRGFGNTGAQPGDL